MLLNNKSRLAAFGGILTALAVLFMFFSSLIPTGKLVFVFIASAVIGIGYNSYGARLSAIVYIASALLSVLIVPEKTYAILYAVVVGNYPLLKPLLERISSLGIRLGVKLAVFNVYMIICCIIGIYILHLPLDSGTYPLWILWIMMLAVFYVYDYAYTLFMQKIYNYLPKNKF